MDKTNLIMSTRQIKVSSKTNQPYEVIIVELVTESKNYELGRIMLNDTAKGLLDAHGVFAKLN